MTLNLDVSAFSLDSGTAGFGKWFLVIMGSINYMLSLYDDIECPYWDQALLNNKKSTLASYVFLDIINFILVHV